MPWRVATFIGTWFTLPWLVIGGFAAGAVPGGWWTLSLLPAFAAIAIAVRVPGFAGRGYPSALTRALLLQPFYYLFLFLPLVAAAAVLGALAGWPFAGPVASARVAILAALGVLGVAIVVGYAGSRRLVVRDLEVRHPQVPAAFDGLRIVQLSDLHVGPHTSRRFLARIAAAIERARPDVLAWTGDQVDDYAADVAYFVRAFGHLRAPSGVYAIAGNHDVYAGWEGVAAGLRGAGIRVLVNDGVRMMRGDDLLWIGGTGDPAARVRGDGAAPGPDLDRTMAHAPDDAFRVVLAHNPALWPGLAKRGAHLTLSGHTHHGQLSIPPLGWSLASPFLDLAMGRHDDGQHVLYINPGTNYWGIPFRIGAWPEVTVVTLRRAAAEPAAPAA
jgi:uncharacterized protein